MLHLVDLGGMTIKHRNKSNQVSIQFIEKHL
jgi:hypothetical protein